MEFVILTADRPAEVRPCASSYLSGRSAPGGIVLLDDSRSSSNLAFVRQEARYLSRNRNIPVRCAGRPDRHRFVQYLSEQGIDPDTAGFCLLGPESGWFTGGAARNAALFDLLGEPLFMVDDDTRGNTAVSPDSTRDIQEGGSKDPTDILFFQSREEAASAANWEAVDLFHEIPRYLGAPVRMAEPDRIIRAVSCGLVGDSGFYSPSHLLWMTSVSTRQRLLSSESVLRTALDSREVVRMALVPTVTRGTVLMTTAVGLDNSAALPPFLPLGRNEDGFFGNLLARCFGSALTLHSPYAVLHVPPQRRLYRRLPAEPQTLRFSELVILLMSAYPLDDTILPAEALRQLGDYLIQLGGAPHRLAPYARAVVQQARRAMLTRIEESMGELDDPSSLWRHQASQLTRSLRELIASPHCWRTIELQNASEASACVETAKWIEMTGRMLRHWYEMLDVTRHLQSKGVRLSG